jgi:hypothetical protein
MGQNIAGLLEQATDAFELTSQRLRYRLLATLPSVHNGFDEFTS